MTGAVRFGGYYPGALGDVVGAHMAYYAPAWGFGAAFETKVAGELSAFLARHDPARHLFVTAHTDAGFAGSITLDGDDPDGAHLRWFIVTDAARGTGLGRALMGRAMDFAATLPVRRVWLTTFAGLDAARHLYESYGFTLVREEARDQWQGGVREQRFEVTL